MGIKKTDDNTRSKVICEYESFKLVKEMTITDQYNFETSWKAYDKGVDITEHVLGLRRRDHYGFGSPLECFKRFIIAVNRDRDEWEFMRCCDQIDHKYTLIKFKENVNEP